MNRFLILAALFAAPAPAQAPPAPGTRQIKIDVSPAGQIVLKKYLGTRDPFIVQRIEQLRGVAQQMQVLSSAPRLDLVRLEALMRQQEALEGTIKRRGNDRTLAMLRELSDADRTKFVRSFRPMAKPPGAQ